MQRADSDRVSGCVFLLIAALFAFPAVGYGLGSGLRLGAGAFPLAVAGLLALVGGAMLIRSFRGVIGEPVLSFDYRAMALIVAALIFGALTIRWLGLVIAIPGTVLIASAASPRLSLSGAIIAAILLTVFCWGVFVLGLQVRLPLLAGVV